MSRIDEILKSRQILIVAGTGGVGKTTVSAALGLRAAALGRKTAVITIDPAKRLATALGMRNLGNQPTDITETLAKHYGSARDFDPSLPEQLAGRLAAVVPDTRKTFDQFVISLSPSPQVRDRVMRNPIYQIFAKEFSGTNEYMALQSLYAVEQLQEYDCIILDTPPSRNTLAFLDAPSLLTRFFEERMIRWLVVPTNKIVSAGMHKALGILENLTGSGFMTNLYDFAAALFEVQVNFTANLKSIMALLGSDRVGFVLVGSAAPENAPEISHFVGAVREHHFHFDGMILNRTLGYLPIDPGPGSQELDLVRALQERERAAIREIQRQLPRSVPLLAELPELARDVHSVEDLFHVAHFLSDRGPRP